MKPVLTRLAVSLALSCAAGSALAAPITLKVGHFLPSTSSAQQKVIQPWCDELERASAGRLVCQIYPSMQLGGTPAKLADQVRQAVNAGHAVVEPFAFLSESATPAEQVTG